MSLTIKTTKPLFTSLLLHQSFSFVLYLVKIKNSTNLPNSSKPSVIEDCIAFFAHFRKYYNQLQSNY